MQATALDRLRAWLDKNAQTQASLARALGLSETAVSRWFSETLRSRPAFVHRAALERITGIPANDWMTAEERRVAFGEGSAE